MAAIVYTPQAAPKNGMQCRYTLDAAAETLAVEMLDGGQVIGTDTFDFSPLAADDIFTGVETILPYPPIVNAERDATTGVLTLTVVNWYDDGQIPPDEIVEVV